MAALAAGFESSLLELAHPGPRCSSAQAAALDAFVTVAVAQAAPDGELTVACRWADGVAPPPAGAACAVMSDLYSALWDAACGAGKLRLKARVVMPGDDAAAAATAAELMRAPLRAVLFDESLGLASLPTMEAIELLNGARAKQALAPVAVCPLDGAKCRAAAGVGDAAVVYVTAPLLLHSSPPPPATTHCRPAALLPGTSTTPRSARSRRTAPSPSAGPSTACTTATGSCSRWPPWWWRAAASSSSA